MGLFGALSNFLTGAVGNNLDNDPQDIRDTKRRLNRLGFFDDEVENDFITRELDNGIKGFQRDNDLRVDGKLLPGGETEREIGIQTMYGDFYDPYTTPDGIKVPPPQKASVREDSPRAEIRPLDAESSDNFEDEEFEDDINPDEDFEDDFPLEGEENEDDGEQGNNQENAFPEVNREEIARRLEEHIHNEERQKQEAIQVLQEKQKENADSKAAGGFGQLPENVDATGRMIRNNTPPIPERKPVVPETTRDSFDLNKAPTVNLEADRIKNILNNDPAKFEIKENPSLNNPTFEERFKQTLIKDKDFGNKIVQNNKKTIAKMAKKHGVNPDLVKSVMWAENARGHRFGINDLLDDVGLSGSQAPMNISGEIWGKLVDKPGEKLDNDEENIEAGVILLKRIEDRLENPTPEKIGSIWNGAGYENVNEMGKEIGQAYKNRPWQKKK